jgi:hypothetical protein
MDSIPVPASRTASQNNRLQAARDLVRPKFPLTACAPVIPSGSLNQDPTVGTRVELNDETHSRSRYSFRPLRLRRGLLSWLSRCPPLQWRTGKQGTVPWATWQSGCSADLRECNRSAVSKSAVLAPAAVSAPKVTSTKKDHAAHHFLVRVDLAQTRPIEKATGWKSREGSKNLSKRREGEFPFRKHLTPKTPQSNLLT